MYLSPLIYIYINMNVSVYIIHKIFDISVFVRKSAVSKELVQGLFCHDAYKADADITIWHQGLLYTGCFSFVQIIVMKKMFSNYQMDTSYMTLRSLLLDEVTLAEALLTFHLPNHMTYTHLLLMPVTRGVVFFSILLLKFVFPCFCHKFVSLLV